jgi:pantothenate kinase-related protein Tda10
MPLTVKVHMLAFHDEPNLHRVVNVEDHRDDDILLSTLSKAYHWGQNDFQPNPKVCSVSVGDVILLEGKYVGKYMVAPMGFRKLTDEQYKELKETPRRDRFFKAYEDSFGTLV